MSPPEFITREARGEAGVSTLADARNAQRLIETAEQAGGRGVAIRYG